MTWSLADLAEKMRDIDFTMLSTRAEDGSIGSRPMSNNRDVDYDGDSFFFALEETRTVEGHRSRSPGRPRSPGQGRACSASRRSSSPSKAMPS